MTSERRSTPAEERLLEVAEKLFAERGYTHATVADITSQAGCNISAVSYHFHGKDELYLAVFRRLVSDVSESRQQRSAPAGPESTSLPDVIEATVRDFVTPFLEDDTGRRLTKLVLQERDGPHLPRDFFVSEVIGPLRRATVERLRPACSALDDTTLELCLDSLVAQLLHLIHSWSLYAGADKAQMPLLDTERALAHIVAFSTAGIRHFLDRSCRLRVH
jgi:AcrR family transcriptional regulator